jgi:DNA invertase Pin-like site-specific DNA recombinase
VKGYIGYIRVSTVKQGTKGVSLQEQRDGILRYAERNQLNVTIWLEEMETAAKRGRPVFNQALKLLSSGKAQGIILHKLDRGARNLRDWTAIGELSDQGVEIHFVTESIDLQSRGGRLSADIQAVVAADYIRNLRDETRKGFYGRLKQGLYPLQAPLGYVHARPQSVNLPNLENAGTSSAQIKCELNRKRCGQVRAVLLNEIAQILIGTMDIPKPII